MLAVLSFFESPIGRYVAAALGVFVMLSGTWVAGDIHGHHACQASQARAVAAAQKRSAAAATHIQQDIVAPLRVANVVKQAAIAERTAVLTKEIPYAIPKSADCPVPVAAVRLLNAAAGLPAVPVPAGGSEPAPADATLSSVVTVALYNDGVAQGALAEDQIWRDWYAKVSVAYGAAIGAPAT